MPDSAPDGMTEKVIKVSDLGVPVAAALGRWEALSHRELGGVIHDACEQARLRGYTILAGEVVRGR